MFERTHGSITRTLLLACGWDWQDAQIAGIASMATDHATPSFLGETHLAEFPSLGMPCPTSLNIDPRKTPEQIGSTWYPGWPILARWHGGWRAYHENRPIRLGDHDKLVKQVAAAYDGTRLAAVRLGMELHAAFDTVTHAGFWPCWHPANRNPEYRKNCLKFWQPLIPPILHAQYLGSVDAIDGVGRYRIHGEEIVERTKRKAVWEVTNLKPRLNRTDKLLPWNVPQAEIAAAADDADLCARLDALACEIAGRELPELAVWPRGNPEWREFFAIARGE